MKFLRNCVLSALVIAILAADYAIEWTLVKLHNLGVAIVHPILLRIPNAETSHNIGFWLIRHFAWMNDPYHNHRLGREGGREAILKRFLKETPDARDNP